MHTAFAGFTTAPPERGPDDGGKPPRHNENGAFQSYGSEGFLKM